MSVYFFDTETTGNTPDDRLCQLAIKERGISEPIVNHFFKPPIPIPFEASAVHHISNKMVADKPLFQNADQYAQVKELFESDDTYMVAHNAAFDVSMLEAEGIHPTHIICTYKLIRHLDVQKEFTNHKLQYLRYALDIELSVPAHDAFADVLVLERVFAYILDRMMNEQRLSEPEALEAMEALSARPILMTELNFGKHKGKSVKEVAQSAPDYLEWLLAEKEKNPIGEEDWIYTLKYHLKRLPENN